MGGRAAVERRVEVLAERGAERRLEAALDLELLHDRRKEAAGGRVEHLLQGAGLGLDPRQVGLGLLNRRAQPGFALPGVGDAPSPRRRRPARPRRARSSPPPPRPASRPGPARPAMRLAISLASRSMSASWRCSRSRRSVASRSARSADWRAAAASARSAVSAPSAASLPPSAALAASNAARAVASRSPAPASSTARDDFLGGQPLQRLGVVAHHALLALDVGVELAEPLVDLRLAGADAAGLLLDLRAGDGQPLEGRRGARLGIAQLRQMMGADRLLLGCGHLAGSALGDRRWWPPPGPTWPPPRAPWRASSADGTGSPRRGGSRPTGS